MRKKTYRKTKKAYILVKLCILMALLLTSAGLLAMSPVFNIENIEVVGSKHYSNSEIINLTDIYVGNNWFKTIGFNLKDIFSFKSSKAEKNILKSRPYVKSATAQYNFSKTVKITLVEREAVMIIPYLGANLILDIDGYVLDIYNEGSHNFPFVKGIKFNNYELGQVLNPENKDNFLVLLKTLKLVKDNDAKNKKKLFTLFDNIDVSDLNKISVNVDERIFVIFGSPEELNDYKVSYLREIFFNRLGPEEKGIINFANGENPVFTPY